jgi:multiple sugar transport system permease protein
MMMPLQVTMVPVYALLRNLGLVNTYAGLVAPVIAGSFGVFLCRQFYVGFPRDLDAAALIDGCGRFGQFARIYLPLSGPLLASLGVLKFTGTWNEYAWAVIMTRGDRLKTVQLALMMFREEADIQWHLLMAATLVVNIPIYCVFLLAQRYFISGLLAGSVKG